MRSIDLFSDLFNHKGFDEVVDAVQYELLRRVEFNHSKTRKKAMSARLMSRLVAVHSVKSGVEFFRELVVDQFYTHLSQVN